MGSNGLLYPWRQVSVELGPLKDATQIERLAETVWTITSFVYSGNSAVEYVLYKSSPRGGVSSTVRGADVDLQMSPDEIQARDVASSSSLSTAENAGTGILRLIRQAALLIAENMDMKCDMKRGLMFCVTPSGKASLRVTDGSAADGSIACLSETISRVCEFVIGHGTTPLRKLDFLGSNTLTQMLYKACIPASVANTPLGDIVAQGAKDHPQRTALDAWDGTLSYSELDDYGRRYAIALRRAGVRVEDRVLLFMQKSKWAVAAMVGILYAGGTCVPMDIRAPKARVEARSAQVSARHAVCDRSTQSVLDTCSMQITTVSQAAADSDDYGLPVVAPSSIAFIFFTSGSTGIPKGILQQHETLGATVQEIARGFRIARSSRVFQYASYVFDVSVGDIFATILMGGCVCVPSEEERLDQLSSAIHRLHATHVCVTNTVVTQMQPHLVPSLKHVLVGGEPLDRAQFERWRAHVDLSVVYGTTESIIWDSVATCTERSFNDRSIGHPIGPCMWVVDPENRNLKPVGAIGEILVEGPLLGQAYLNDPKATGKQFIAAPPWLRRVRDDESVRCYCTGDLGYMNFDGSISFLGRVDTQVKIRGQRVELGEIEQACRETSSGLEQVAVDTVSIRGSAKTLVAFISYHQQTTTNGHQRACIQMEKRLGETLPQYMIPSMFVPVKEMPLTATGKLDRPELRRWIESLEHEEAQQYFLAAMSTTRAPENENERCLQAVWAKVLRIEAKMIGAEDHFFHLGGDSVIAMELVGELRDLNRTLAVSQVFQHPRLCDMAKEMAQVEDDVDIAPFSLLSADCIDEVAKCCGVARDLIQDIYPTTPMQEALFAISARRTQLYTHQAVFSLPSTLDIDRFKSAWKTLAAAQSILRTRIVFTAGGAVQAVLRTPLEWKTHHSLPQYLEEDRSDVMKEGSELSRYAIVANKYFVWSGHHVIYDGWSQPKMFEEVQAIYLGSTAAPEAPYKRFIQHLQQQDDDEFWRAQFPDINEGFPRVGDGYEPNARLVKSQSLEMPEIRSEISAATLVEAAWALVTARHADTGDASYALTLSGRDATVPGITRMLGPTITTVPLRLNIDYTMSVEEFLQDVQDQVWQVRAHQHAGLQRIRQLSPEARSAVDFQNLLVVHPAEESLDLSRLGMAMVQSEESDAVDRALTMQCTIGDTLKVVARYDDSVVPSTAVDRLLDELQHILLQLGVDSSKKSIWDLDLMSRQNLDQLSAWNPTVPPAAAKTIHGLFEERVRTCPEATAITGFDGSYSYAQLNEMANKLAPQLQAGGITPEVCVVLCFSKSTWPIVAMLATLKCGGVCVSVNPQHPDSRLLEIASDVEAGAVLCDAQYASRFEGHVPHVIVVDGNVQELAWKPPQLRPSNGAFVVYTSGSTGKPKGSLLEHRCLATSLTAIGRHSDITAQSRVLQFSAYTFDAHILEIFGTLIHGGCIIVISDSERMDRLGDTIKQRHVNWALLTPTVARLLPAKETTLETLILSGEPLAQQDIQKWAPSVQLLNGLGPSECSILACITREPVAVDGEPSNIGHSLGCNLWITDRRRPNRLVPVGCVGELTVEGPIIGRGYVRRPKATAAAFIIDPEWSHDGSQTSRRFYRTGDLARFNEDGSVAFIGRADTQVKIRGQRVELEEIEHQLKASNSCFENVIVDVLTLANRGNTQQLTAFVVATQPGIKEDGLQSADVLRSEFMDAQRHLSSILPLFMVPSLFIPLYKLPISPSGKLERRTLRQWVLDLAPEALASYFLTQDVRQPNTSNERQLQALWSEVLHVPAETISTKDNFFQLGGDSVMAMELVAIARSRSQILSVAGVFANPTLVDMATKLSHGTSQRKVEPFALVDRDRQIAIQEASQDCQVDPEEIEDIYPCTPMQEALIAVSSHLPKAYTHQAVFKIPASLDVARFKSAWEQVVATQPIFRTRIIVMHGLGSHQVVLRSDVRWKSEISLQRYLEADRDNPIEYGAELNRFAIVNNEAFVWTGHHSIYDGWTLPRAFEQVRSVYNGSLPRAAVPFNVFIQHLRDIKQEDSDAFWKAQFPTVVEGFPQLPSANYVPRPTKRRSITISPHRPKNTVTMATIVQSAWAIVTARYAGADEAVFGLTLSGRDAPVNGITDMVAPTLTTVPMRIAIDRSKNVAELLADVQEQVALVRKYQHAGLQRIRRLSPEARTATAFQNLLIIQTMGDAEILTPFGDLGLEPIDVQEDDFLDLALTTEVIVRPENIEVHLQYDSGAVSDGQVGFLIRQFEHAISLLADEPARCIKDLDMVSQHDRAQLEAWNADKFETVEGILHNMFEDQVKLRPNEPATSGFDCDLTYSELDASARAIAAHLARLGVGPEVRVVLCFAKSTMPIIAMVAVLKAGGVVVSTNVDHPTRRITEICEDCESNVILCDPKSVVRFQDCIEHVVGLDSKLITSLGMQTDEFSPPTMQPDNAAFIVYTSGSTGKPKGCVLEHRSVCTSQRVNSKAMYIGAGTRAVQFASYTFDASICEIFAPLVVGGCVCVISDEERMNDLPQAINDRKADWIMLTPTVAALFGPSAVPDLKTLIFGGEALSRQVLGKWLGEKQLVNYWGPSECSNSGCLNNTLSPNTDPLNIGRASGCKIWLAEHGRPDYLVPVGCVGEILVEGPMLGREYVKRPEITARAWITDPAWSRGGSESRRFYRTGDLARFNADGSVTFIGRADTQVKIRGQRVELGEIEHQIRTCLEGCEVVAQILTGGELNEPTLVAFVCEQNRDGDLGDAPPLSVDLGRALADTLPEYMIPSAFVPIAFVPTTPSGKADRARLKQYAQSLAREALFVSREEKRQPENDMQRTLQGVWSQVLNYSQADIGIDDVFTSLGGDSITAMQIVAECRKLNIKATVATILEKKTITQIAPLCQQKQFTSEKATDEVPFKLSPVQQVYFEKEGHNWNRYNQSFLLRVRRNVSAQNMQRAFDAIVKRHPMLRARFSHNQSGWTQRTVVASSYRFIPHQVDLIQATIDAVSLASSHSIDLVNGPVFSVDFFDAGNEDATIYMIAHHAVIDLVSWRIIWRDLEEVLVNGSLSAPATMSFHRWNELQYEQAQRQSAMEVLPTSIPHSDLGFWGVKEDENTIEASQEAAFSLPPEVTSMLLHQSNTALRNTTLDVLVAMLVFSFRAIFTERDAPIISIEHHGRVPWNDDIDIEQTVGWFTTTYPVYVPPTSTAMEAVRLAKDQRATIPESGRAYFAHHHLVDNAPLQSEVLINYAGIFQQLESDGLFAAESRVATPDSETDPKAHRWSLIDVNIDVSHGSMNFSFRYNKAMAHLSRMQEWVNAYKTTLVTQAAQLAEMPHTYTLSDFPLARLTYGDLDDLISSLPSGVVGNIQDMFPCTKTQEGILISQQKDEQAYKVTCVWEIRDSSIKDCALELAWTTLVKRHSTLRTGIAEDATADGHFLQIVLMQSPQRFAISDEKTDIQEITAKPLPDEEKFWSHMPRVTVYRLNNGRKALRLEASHVMLDGMSMDILINEFVELLEGKVPRGATMEYSRFVEYEQSLSSAESREYWSKYLQGVQPCPIPTTPKTANGSGTYTLPPQATEGVIAMSRRLGITPAALLQTAWGIVLGAFTGQNDVAFGYLASVRDAPIDNIESAVGLLISMQVCRVKLSGSIEDILGRVQEDIITGLKHRHYSLASIHHALGFQGALFNTCLAIRRSLTEESRVDDVLDILDMPERTEYSISLNATIEGSQVSFSFDYRLSDISDEYAQSIGGSLETVINAIVHGQYSIENIPTIGAKDQKQVMEWNSNVLAVTEDTIHGMFAAQVKADPDAIATSGFDGEYTYSEIDAVTTALAAHIHDLGVGPEVPVILCFAKSTWPIVAMLAVLKAGGVVVSVNTEHPDRRLLELCDDVNAAVVLCDPSSVPRFEGHVPHSVGLDRKLIASLPPRSWTPPTVQPTNAAFIVYTSGSTGKPKGCVLEHRSVCTSQVVNAKAMHIDRDTRAVQFAAYTFDASICEIFAPLIVGGCVVVISDHERMNDLAGVVRVRDAHWIMLTPTVAQLFGPSAVPNLKTLIFGGEALSRQVRDAWSEQHVKLVNYYGPSECCNSVCLNPSITTQTNPMNIGRSSGCHIWIAEQGKPNKLAPIGCVGEILVEGPMLGREYVKRPEASAKSFITSLEWAKNPRRRFYRTGDLARLNLDGSVTFVGRADGQVKIRGQRVELGEIEHQIREQLPSGAEVVVQVIEKDGNSKDLTLTAFIRANALVELDGRNNATGELGCNTLDQNTQHKLQAATADLQQSLGETLPAYMVPTVYLPVRFIPTTPSGKVDRARLRQLAAEARSSAGLQRSFATKREASTDIERKLQVAWSRVLNCPETEIGMDDSFLALGGDSISAMQVVSECRKVNIRVAVATILTKQTIGAIAPHCIQKKFEKSRQVIDEVPWNLAPAQALYFSKEFQSWTPYSQSFLVRCPRTTPQQLRDALDQIVERHAMLRARFRFDSTWRQRTIPSSSSKRAYAFRTQDAVLQDIEKIAEDSTAQLNIVDGPVFSVDYIRVPGDDPMVFFAAHHLVVDLVSWRIIWSDLDEILQGRPLHAPTMSFQEWCSVQETDARRIRASIPAIPPNMFDFWGVAQSENVLQNTISESFTLGAEITEMLNTSNAAFRTRTLDLVLAPLVHSFRQKFAERPVPTVMIEHHGRDMDDAEIEHTVGWFTALYPLHVDVGAEDLIEQVVRRVKDGRRAVPQNGRAYFAARHLHPEVVAECSHHDPAELIVNFAGSFQQLDGEEGPLQRETRVQLADIKAEAQTHRWSLIDVNVDMQDGRMCFSFRLHRDMTHLGRLCGWINDYQEALATCARKLKDQKPSFTPSDFPHASLSDPDLEQLTAQFGDNIVDVLPITPFQQQCVNGNLFCPPELWDHLFLDVPHTDAARLTQVCCDWINHFSVLRTTFVQSSSGYCQVMLRRVEPAIELRKDTDSDTICRELMTRPRQLGEPFVTITILDQGSQMRVIVGVSHALYDGMSLGNFASAFATIHDRRQPLPPIEFSHYVEHMLGNRAATEQYWTSVLEDAVLPQLPQSADLNVTGTHRTSQCIAPLKDHAQATNASQFSATCAIALSELTGSQDVTFGRLVSGRGGLSGDFQSVIGPCINYVPVRANTQDDINAVIAAVHKQAVDSMAYEAVDADKLLMTHAKGDAFPFITQYQNVNVAPEAAIGSSTLRLHEWDQTIVQPYSRSISILGRPSPEGLNVFVSASPKFYSRDTVEMVCGKLCEVLSRLNGGA